MVFRMENGKNANDREVFLHFPVGENFATLSFFFYFWDKSDGLSTVIAMFTCIGMRVKGRVIESTTVLIY